MDLTPLGAAPPLSTRRARGKPVSPSPSSQPLRRLDRACYALLLESRLAPDTDRWTRVGLELASRSFALKRRRAELATSRRQGFLGRLAERVLGIVPLRHG
jgi:hypothetical protein